MQGTYDPALVTLSIVVAIASAFTGLELAARIALSRGAAARAWLIGGASATGIGIWSMHFIGMLAFKLPIRLTYDIPVTLLSGLVAMLGAGLCLWIVSRKSLSPVRMLSGAVFLAGGIGGMHYLGMAAINVHPGIDYDLWLVLVSLGLAIAASGATIWIGFRLPRHRGLNSLARRIGAAMLMGIAISGMHYTGMAAAHFSPEAVCVSGLPIDNGWLAATLSLISFGTLGTALLLSLLDAQISSRTAQLALRLQAANEELRILATHDALTRLPNRVLMEDRIAQSMAQAKRHGRCCALMYIDLDRFKNINDSLGHQVGDRLLKAAAGTLETLLRREDTVARVGGDEFVVMLHEIAGPSDAAVVARKLLDALGRPVTLDGLDLHVSASIGIALYPMDASDADALMASADMAMYHAKKSGGNDFRFFGPEMNVTTRTRLMLENGLRRALKRGEFELHYQPKVDVKTGEITSMEALIRWRDPARGLVPPMDFIPLAEETGLIVPIGEWVLSEACRQNKTWQESGMRPLRVAVNLSATQFRQSDLLKVVAKALKQTGLDPGMLELELTESTVMQNAEQAVRVMEQLTEMGVHISVDDFGTGYSSLSYLKRLPIHKLKIDRSFVRDLTRDADDAVIVRAIVSLAHNLRLRVIAEGVETHEQLAFLEALGCDEFQGYLCSPPVGSRAFELLMQPAAVAVDA